ncbi:MAG: hypothetical protein GDA43_25245, partial [Hormoscilla sp. SP5CHS1]|nr:hypothetical protein [Hormoscilla sp. SP5CHS1]
KLTVVRYADDFVVMHDDRSMIEQAKGVVEQWLMGIGLRLKAEKTKISHTLEGEDPGFDFLGINIRQYKVGKYRSGKLTNSPFQVTSPILCLQASQFIYCLLGNFFWQRSYNSQGRSHR